MVLSGEQLHLLLKSARGKALAALIKEAMIAPTIFHYEEILSHPNVTEMAASDDSEVEPLINTLRLFTYGSYEDYIADQQKFLVLSMEQIEKLRLLSLMSIAIKNCRIKYDFLNEKLGLAAGDYQKLEEIIMSAMCTGALQGQMDQENKILHVQGVQGRDVQPSEISLLSKRADEWCQSMEGVLKDALHKEKVDREESENRQQSEKRFQEELQSIKKVVKMEMEERRENSDFRQDGPVEMRPKKSKLRVRKN